MNTLGKYTTKIISAAKLAIYHQDHTVLDVSLFKSCPIGAAWKENLDRIKIEYIGNLWRGCPGSSLLVMDFFIWTLSIFPITCIMPARFQDY